MTLQQLAVDEVTAATYNPRRITPEDMDRLCESLRTHGFVKPVIANADRTLVAGHQRTQAAKRIGMTHVPAIVLDVAVPRQEEIRFNLLHNSIETNHQAVRLAAPLYPGWVTVHPSDVTIDGIAQRGRGAVMGALGDLLRKYGPWGSCIADMTGQVIVNADYAAACARLDLPLLVHVTEDPDGVLQALSGEYGAYDYTALDVKPYHQTFCQMYRKGVSDDSTYRSTLYEDHVIPRLAQGERCFDFGAGMFGYVNLLRDQGHLIDGYEPYLRKTGQDTFDYPRILDSMRRLYGSLADGLFDVVICDSVLNSITSLDYERHVVATCAALTAPDGRLHLATRNLGHAEKEAAVTHVNNSERNLQFLDANHFSATYRRGAWTLQRFHTADTLGALLGEFYRHVEITGTRTSGQWYAVCTEPRPQDPAALRRALEVEFDMCYPDDFRLNRAKPLVERILSLQPPV